MMYTFMIADDEKAIRESIPKVIDFEKYGFSLCATARDGEEALCKAKELQPDLVLLDIRMPGLDGIGFLEAARGCDLQHTNIVILSVYSDFTYAKKALQFGAKGYFTKPLDEDEFTDFLKELREELDKKNHIDRKDRIHMASYKLKQMYQEGNGEREGYKDFKLMHVAVLRHPPFEDVCGRIEKSLEELLKDEVELFLCKGGVYSFLCSRKALELQGIMNELLLSHVMNRLQNQGMECAILIDDNVFDRTGNTFRTDFDTHLYTMLTDLFWEKKKSLVLYSKITRQEETDCWSHLKDDVMHLREAIEQENECEALQILDTIFEKAGAKHMEYTSMVDLYYRIFYILKEFIISREDMINPLGAERWQDKPFFMTCTEMRNKCREYIVCVLHCRNEMKRKQKLGVGEKAMEYIRHNYTRQLMLKDVADALHVNPAYLGRCIQKETGLSFNSMLARFRIEKAKELLRDTDLRVYEIAEAVGYLESKHFVAKFTAVEGMAPLSYKKQFQKV